MRDLLYKNLTSSDGRKKVLASSEISEKEGVRSIIRRHFICMVMEVKQKAPDKPLPYLYVLKERNTSEHLERFFCRIKGSVYAVTGKKLFLIRYTHSLKIDLTATPATL